MTLANCTICGKLFNRNGSRVCPGCLECEEEEFDRAVEYMREHDVRSVIGLADGTGIAKKRILGWVRDGKLDLEQGAEYGAGQCRRCGKPTGAGDICVGCRAKIAQQIAYQRSQLGNGEASGPYGGMHSKMPNAAQE